MHFIFVPYSQNNKSHGVLVLKLLWPTPSLSVSAAALHTSPFFLAKKHPYLLRKINNDFNVWMRAPPHPSPPLPAACRGGVDRSLQRAADGVCHFTPNHAVEWKGWRVAQAPATTPFASRKRKRAAKLFCPRKSKNNLFLILSNGVS